MFGVRPACEVRSAQLGHLSSLSGPTVQKVLRTQYCIDSHCLLLQISVEVVWKDECLPPPPPPPRHTHLRGALKGPAVGKKPWETGHGFLLVPVGELASWPTGRS